MRRVMIRFPIIVYPSESADIGRFTAHCLNMDLRADADTVEGAVGELLEVIEVQLNAGEDYCADPFLPADQKYWEMLPKARELPAELMERIVRDANRRWGDDETAIDVNKQCDLRQVETAFT